MTATEYTSGLARFRLRLYGSLVSAPRLDNSKSTPEYLLQLLLFLLSAGVCCDFRHFAGFRLKKIKAASNRVESQLNHDAVVSIQFEVHSILWTDISDKDEVFGFWMLGKKW